jgi:transcriptional regulator of acetoin/glycerol metabolism
LIEELFTEFMRGDVEKCNVKLIFYSLPIHEKRKVLYAFIRQISKQYPPKEDDQRYIAGLAAVISELVEFRVELQTMLVDWLTDASSESVGSDMETRRAVLTALPASAGPREGS